MSALPESSSPTLSSIIRTLMEAHKLHEAELARKTGVPQTTINRLLLGETLDPRTNTLKPLAHYFDVTVGQLLGEEPLEIWPTKKVCPQQDFVRCQKLPVLTWEQMETLYPEVETLTPKLHRRWARTEYKMGAASFALEATEAMEPRFKKGSLLLIDSEAPLRPNLYTLLLLKDETLVLKQACGTNDEGNWFFKDFNLETEKTLPEGIQKILGVVVEARMRY